MPLPFEKPIDELEAKIIDMRTYAEEQGIDFGDEIEGLEKRLELLKRETFDSLTRWQRVQVARAPGRPTALDYIQGAFESFSELHGDRVQGDDPALVAGLARLGKQSVVVLAQQKGRDTKENIHRNFGMLHPSGYRKALRMFDLADKFRLPVVTLIDTPGAYPGIAAEEGGQAWVIAESIRRMSRLKVPALSIVIGEGGSGGALAIGVANRVLILGKRHLLGYQPRVLRGDFVARRGRSAQGGRGVETHRARPVGTRRGRPRRRGAARRGAQALSGDGANRGAGVARRTHRFVKPQRRRTVSKSPKRASAPRAASNSSGFDSAALSLVLRRAGL